MATGLSKSLTKIGIEEQVDDTTYVAPSGVNSYVQPLEDGFSISGSKELKERSILTVGYTKAQARAGRKSLEWGLNVEARGSGTEGAQPDFHPLLKNTFGLSRNSASRVTSSTGHSSTVINMTDTSAFNVGDICILLESGNHHVSPIITVTTNTSITLLVAAPFTPSDSVEISKFQTYYTSNSQSDYSPLSLSFYHANEILEKGVGCRPNSFTLSNFTTGELASFDFSGTGVDFDRTDSSAPHTPSFDSEVPPLVFGGSNAACVYLDGSAIECTEMQLSMEHANGDIPEICSASGSAGTRKTGQRNISGSFVTYLDSSDVTLYNKFKQNTAYSLFWFAANPSSTAGEIDLGSCWGIYLPSCISNGDVVGDLDGISTVNVEFTADGTSSGQNGEIYLGMI